MGDRVECMEDGMGERRRGVIVRSIVSIKEGREMVLAVVVEAVVSVFRVDDDGIEQKMFRRTII